MFKYLLFVTTLVLFTGCRQTTKVTPWSATKQMPPPPGFITEIPLEKRGRDSGKPSIFYGYKQRYCRWIHFDSLETGFDSIQIRVWLGCDLCKLKHVVIIENTDLRWSAKLVTIGPVRPNSSEDDSRVDLIGVTACTPSHGWDYLLNKMKQLRIAELPNGRDIGCTSCIDGTSYLFEIATRYKYRFLNYGCPEDCADKVWQAKNVLTFAHLLEEEFGFTYAK